MEKAERSRWYDRDGGLISTFTPFGPDAYQRYTDFVKKDEYLYISDMNNPRIMTVNIKDGRIRSIPYSGTSSKSIDKVGKHRIIKILMERLFSKALLMEWYECDEERFQSYFR